MSDEGRHLFCWIPLKDLTSVTEPGPQMKREKPTLLGPSKRVDFNQWTTNAGGTTAVVSFR
jgi:hypothetical protein